MTTSEQEKVGTGQTSVNQTWEKDIDRTWTHITDYYYTSTLNWKIECDNPDVRCKVGMGVFLWGEPLGEKIGFNGKCEFMTLGSGAIYAKIDDDTPGKVRVVLTRLSP